MLKDFYDLLFDRGQSTCFSSTVKGTSVSRVRARTDNMFFAINALDATKDRQPTEEYHRADRARRADHNVICFRNFLIEMDFGALSDQERLIKDSGLPWSTCVASGGRSLHYLISLRDPLSDRLAYARLVKRIYSALSPRVKIDVANKNPSRFSRCPGAWRTDKNALQKLMAVRDRVDLAVLELWLKRFEPREVAPSVEAAQILNFRSPSRIFQSTEQFLKSGAPAGEWNTGLFRAACNLFSVGVSFEEAIGKFRMITGTLDARDTATIKSAYRRVQTGASV